VKHARCHWLLLAERVEAVRDDAGPDRGSAGMDAIERLEHRQNLLTGESGEKSCCKSGLSPGYFTRDGADHRPL